MLIKFLFIVYIWYFPQVKIFLIHGMRYFMYNMYVSGANFDGWIAWHFRARLPADSRGKLQSFSKFHSKEKLNDCMHNIWQQNVQFVKKTQLFELHWFKINILLLMFLILLLMFLTFQWHLGWKLCTCILTIAYFCCRRNQSIIYAYIHCAMYIRFQILRNPIIDITTKLSLWH